MSIRFRNRPVKPFTLFLLATVVLGSLALVRMRQVIDRELQSSVTQLHQASRLTTSKASVPEARERHLSRAGERQWGEQVTLLNRDWSRLLNSLAPVERQTKLLSIDVNPMTSAVRVSGVTDSSERANAYAEALEANAAAVSHVRILTLQSSGQGVNFEMSASWNE